MEGVTILQPYASATEEKWFRGTAHAIYQNFSYIEDYDPDFILVLSGDHIYKMNYESMLDFHKEKEAALTIAVLEVPWEEAPRFGIMNADEELRINEFEEKPEKPKSNLASMGIYIFNWKLLKKYMNENINAGKNMTTSERMSFLSSLMPMKESTPIHSRVTGRMWVHWILYGKRIWIFWIRTQSSDQ